MGLSYHGVNTPTRYPYASARMPLGANRKVYSAFCWQGMRGID
jgi:hypothetical protein